MILDAVAKISMPSVEIHQLNLKIYKMPVVTLVRRPKLKCSLKRVDDPFIHMHPFYAWLRVDDHVVSKAHGGKKDRI